MEAREEQPKISILYITRHFNHSGYLILKRLIEEGFNITGVLLKKESSPYKTPVLRWLYIALYKFKTWYYRGQPLKTLMSEEILARRNKLNILSHESIKSDAFYKDLQQLNPDIVVLGGGWHELLPERVFNFARFGCINTHPSLLPEFRGTSITRWQVLHGIDKSGSTIHYVDDKFDTGGALVQREIPVSSSTTPQELFYKLGEVGADIMVDLLNRIHENGTQEAFFPQNNEEYYSYFKRWTWSEERLTIDWNQPLRKIHFFVLANAQESYQYLGPIVKIGSDSFFLRRTKLHVKAGFDWPQGIPDKKIVCIKITDKSIYIGRSDDDHVLELEQLQKYDKHYKLRRAKKASRCVKVKVGDLLFDD